MVRTDDKFLRSMFDAAVAAADPAVMLPAFLPSPPRGRTIVVGAGKAAASMARAVEDHWDGPLGGLVVTRYGHTVPCRKIEIIEASHPVPDARGAAAARKIIAAIDDLSADDLVLCLISGGGSALLSLPAPGLDLADKQAINKALLKSGAAIDEINCVRKHLSAIKGGRLAAAAYPARVVTLAISDVPGDDLSVIASGPTVGDETSAADARAILQRYAVTPPPRIIAHLLDDACESPSPGDIKLSRSETRLIATPQVSLTAAAAIADTSGYQPLILGDSIEGEAREVARVFAAIARQAWQYGEPARPPCVLLSGGETTVTVRGKGRGGRNVEFLLALAIALDGHDDIWAIACDTDGIDGTEDNAGAIVRPDTLKRAIDTGIDPRAALADNDGYSFFSGLGDLVITGPTLTNVNDLRAIVINRINR